MNCKTYGQLRRLLLSPHIQPISTWSLFLLLCQSIPEQLDASMFEFTVTTCKLSLGCPLTAAHPVPRYAAVLLGQVSPPPGPGSAPAAEKWYRRCTVNAGHQVFNILSILLLLVQIISGWDRQWPREDWRAFCYFVFFFLSCWRTLKGMETAGISMSYVLG